MRPKLPPLNFLRAFEAAARLMSFTEAAKELHVTQAAVSQQVKQLEDLIGTPLFSRLPRKLELTDAGHGYLPIVRHAFDHLAAGTEEVFGAGREGPVTVRVTTSLTYLWLTPRLGRFWAAHPGVNLRLITSIDLQEPGLEGVDLEIRYGGGAWPGVEAERLFSEELFPVCSPALMDGPHPLREPADLARHAMIQMIGEPENWPMWLGKAGAGHITPPRYVQFDLHMNATRAACAGLGVALGLSPMVNDALAEGRLVAPFDPRIPATHAHYLLTPGDAAPRPAVSVFKEWLLAEADST
jgi:LysR family glycine cleavage system transcriptional activator